MSRKAVFLLCLPLLLILYSCNQNQQPRADDTPTTGSIKIAVDETLKPISETWKDTFNALYPQAKISITYMPEAELFKSLVYDSVFFVIAAREPNVEESAIFAKKFRQPSINKLAFDGIAVVVNNANGDTLLSMEKILDLLSNKITKWQQISPESHNKSEVKVYFDGNKSSIVRYFSDTLPGKKVTFRNSIILTSCKEVVDAVAKDKNAIGFINLNWISDDADSTSQSFLSTVRVAEIAPPDTARTGGFYYKPYLADLALQRYPFMRSIYAINTEGRVGLATGFASFLAGEKGQRIALKSGILPATMPVRLVRFTN